jgi:uncharacterized membrane protein HdeD (DUF308 family)
MSVYRHDDIVDTPVGTTRSTVRARRFSPGQVVSGVLGAFLLVLGIVAVTRTGVDASLNQPVTELFGLKHSAYVGLFEVFVGLLLLLGAGSAAYRGAAGFAGALLLVGGLVIVAGNLRILLDVGAEPATGWLGIVTGAVAILAAMLPSYRSSHTEVVERPAA